MEAKKVKQTKHSGMGSIVHTDGVAFRVWAPHAEAVNIVGEFNHWQEDSHALEHEGNAIGTLIYLGQKLVRSINT